MKKDKILFFFITLMSSYICLGSDFDSNDSESNNSRYEVITINDVLNEAIVKGDIQIIKNLLEDDIYNDVNINKLLFDAVNYGKEDIVQLALKNGANIESLNEQGISSLYTAAYRGFVNIVKILLENGAKMQSINCYHPILCASYKGHIEIVKLLLRYGADPEVQYKGKTAFYIALQRGHKEVAGLLLTYAARFNIKVKWKNDI